MSLIDGLIILVIAISTVLGLFRGLFRELFSLAIWLGALLVAYIAGPYLQEALAPHVGATLARPAGFITVFLAVLLLGAFAVRLGGALISSTGLSGTDRILGMVFGAARGAVIVIVLLIAARGLFGEEAWWQASPVIAFLLAFEHYVLDVLRAAITWVGGILDSNG